MIYAEKLGSTMPRKVLLNILHDAQKKEGFLSEETLKKISAEQNIPISHLYGVASFYHMLYTKKQGKHILCICGSPSCVLNDGKTIEKFLESELKIKIGETTPDGLITVYKTSCIGCCDEAPAMLVDELPETKLTIPKIRAIIKKLKGKKK